MALSGILLIDKPEGWTSHDVIAKLRGILHERRIGHSGTLDPMATGLLAVFVGRATRAVEFAESHEKEYIASLRLGVTTDTQDTTGNILRSCDACVDRETLENALTAFRGRISQVPPMYSAIKVGGQKLYDIARRGGEVERKSREIEISRLEILGGEGAEWQLRVRCSKGTYIRTLCNDIGESLGCGGAMSALRRTACGEYSIDNALTLEQVQVLADEGKIEQAMLPIDSLFADRDRLVINAKNEKKCRSGAEFAADCSDGEYRVYSETGEFLMLGRAKNGRIKTIKNFFEV
jgi:tRNA pseudouridine55 synthase